ncbi:MAG: reverse transcriptase domain-containing protein, partial [Planctomycetaceae bacterium]
LSDTAGLSDWLDLFPLGETGVAQGSLLSVTVGNLALRQFDQRLNADGLSTVRYLDDFAILATSREQARAGLELARSELTALGLDCYLPGDGSQKGWLVPIARGFEFLGCRVHPSGLSPARRARRQLLTRVTRLLADGRRRIHTSARGGGSSGDRESEGAAQVLMRVDHAVRGWGDAFRFLTNRAALAQLDREIDRRVEAFVAWCEVQARGVPSNERRRLRGVGLLTDLAPRRLPATNAPPNSVTQVTSPLSGPPGKTPAGDVPARDRAVGEIPGNGDSDP